MLSPLTALRCAAFSPCSGTGLLSARVQAVGHLDCVTKHDVAWPEGMKVLASHKALLKKLLAEYKVQFGSEEDEDEDGVKVRAPAPAQGASCPCGVAAVACWCIAFRQVVTIASGRWRMLLSML